MFIHNRTFKKIHLGVLTPFIAFFSSFLLLLASTVDLGTYKYVTKHINSLIVLCSVKALRMYIDLDKNKKRRVQNKQLKIHGQMADRFYKVFH